MVFTAADQSYHDEIKAQLDAVQAEIETLSPKHSTASSGGGGGAAAERRLSAEAQPFFVRSPPSSAAEPLEQQIETRQEFEADGGWNAIWQTQVLICKI